jgi:hypothetical protein
MSAKNESNTAAAFDRDEAFWQKIRTLPDEVKSRPDIQGMLMVKSKAQQLNRDIEDAIELRLAGWTASMPSGELEPERVFSWQWRRPGPKGGRLFLSTQQAINALRKPYTLDEAMGIEPGSFADFIKERSEAAERGEGWAVV